MNTFLKQSLLSLSLFVVTKASFSATVDQNKRLKNIQQNTPTKKSTQRTHTPLDNLEISGLIEVETFYTNSKFGEPESDTTVATVELGIASDITNNINAAIVLLFEEDETDLEIDTAEITYSLPKQVF